MSASTARTAAAEPAAASTAPAAATSTTAASTAASATAAPEAATAPAPAAPAPATPAPAAASERAAASNAGADCPTGTFCTWTEGAYSGGTQHVNLAEHPLEECITLPETAQSFANSTDRPVTVYADEHCGSELDFSTFPQGAQVPEAEYPARAIKVWRY
ncbi:peptidase inhibitor family I36 protein [Bounagaea algeriensis]